MNNIKRFLAFFQRLRTSTLTTSFFLAGMLCFALVPHVVSNTQDQLNNIFVPMGFLWWSMAGIPMITRQEVDCGFFVVEGPIAIILGIFMFLSNFLLSLLPVIGRLLK